MSAKQIIFYSISSDLGSISTKLCEKLYDSRENTLFLFDNDESLKMMDTKLWTFSKLSFIPHGSRFSLSLDDAASCCIWLSTSIEFINHPTCLIHNGLSVIDNMQNFEKIIDVFDKTQVDFAKERSVLYKNLGFDNQKIWEQSGAQWNRKENFL